MATIIKKNQKYFIQYWNGPKRKTIRTDLKVAEENWNKVKIMKERIEDKLEVKKRNIKYRDIFESINSQTTEKDITIDKAVEMYKLKLALTSKTYQDRFFIALKYFSKIVSLNTKISRVTFEHSLLFVKLLSDLKISNASLRTYYEHIKMMFHFLVKHKYLVSSPLNTDVLPRKVKKEIVVFEKEMLDNILSTSKEMSEKTVDLGFYNILVMLLLTGLRPIDLLRIKAGDINFAERIIYIKISKTGKEINYPMSQNLFKFISEEMTYVTELETDQLIFPEYSVSRVGRRFRRLKSKLGIKERYVFTLKTFRKHFGTHYAKGLNIQDVAYLLGHDEISTTRGYYSKVLTDNVRSKMDRFDEKNNLK